MLSMLLGGVWLQIEEVGLCNRVICFRFQVFSFGLLQMLIVIGRLLRNWVGLKLCIFNQLEWVLLLKLLVMMLGMQCIVLLRLCMVWLVICWWVVIEIECGVLRIGVLVLVLVMLCLVMQLLVGFSGFFLVLLIVIVCNDRVFFGILCRLQVLLVFFISFRLLFLSVLCNVLGVLK